MSKSNKSVSLGIEHEDKALENLAACGRLLCISKSYYRDLYTNREPIFNSNIFTSQGKIWFGDIDLVLDKNSLQKLANDIQENIYILNEMDGRFGAEDRSLKSIIKDAKATISPEFKLDL